MKKLIGIFAAMSLVACASAVPLETVRISSCYDGDTCTTSSGEKIRLACIDAPEMNDINHVYNEMYSEPSRDYLRRLVVGRDVNIRRVGTGPYGRTVAELFVDGRNIQQELVKSGHAHIHHVYARHCPWTK